MKPFGGADLGRRDAQVTADQCGIRSFLSFGSTIAAGRLDP